MSHVANIMHTYCTATDDEHDAGLVWYANAQALAVVDGRDLRTGAGVLAAYSPQTPWWRNVEMARESLATGVARTDTLGWNARSAQRILDGENPFDVFGGLKTRAFTENIMGNLDAVTVDSIALSVAMGRHIFSKDAKMGKPRYREIANAYVIAAANLDMPPAIVQTITWVSWRNLFPNKAARKGADAL